ncbi:hypothetical protein GWO13_02180 [Candidatus Bathyarchaeota archaeon]|nr:hypothetical protein [Candidatus Bathyarchaeota archaeon]
MPYCPECGGEMKYISATKRHVCKSCGLSVTSEELFELRRKLRSELEESEEEQRQRQRRDYLKWWLSKKK